MEDYAVDINEEKRLSPVEMQTTSKTLTTKSTKQQKQKIAF